MGGLARRRAVSAPVRRVACRLGHRDPRPGAGRRWRAAARDARALRLIHDLAARRLLTLDAETAHGLTISLLKTGLGPRLRSDGEPSLAIDLCGLRLPNCVGLAAGFDKNAEVADAMLRTGLGFVECGTVTPLPQPGNPRPRLFRLAEDRAVI